MTHDDLRAHGYRTEWKKTVLGYEWWVAWQRRELAPVYFVTRVKTLDWSDCLDAVKADFVERRMKNEI